MTTFVPRGPTRFRHQRVGLRKMIETRGVTALLFDPGTGKTATTLDYCSLLALKSPTQEARVLVIAPLAAVDTWVTQAETYVAEGVAVWAEALGGSIRQRAEALAARGGHPLPGTEHPKSVAPRAAGYRRAIEIMLRWPTGQKTPERLVTRGPDVLPGPRLVLCAINVDSFNRRDAVTRSMTTADLMVSAVKRFEPDLIVIDESHRIKSPSSNTSRAIARLTDVCRRRVILTGTVMPHSPLDVFGQWRFLEPYAFGSKGRQATLGAFRDRFAQLGGWMGKEVVGFKNLDEMQDIMARNAVVARKEDALDLPATTDVTVPVVLSAAEARSYAEMKKSLASMLDSGVFASAPNRLTQMMRLRQITSGFIIDDTGELTVLGQTKARIVKSIVHDTLAGEQRLVVFAHFRHEIALLVEALSAKGTTILSVTGETPSKERTAIRRRFGSDDPARIVLVAQMRTMSLAVNELVTANHAIYASLSLDRADYIQSRDRLNRQGQTRPVTFWHALAPKSVDEVILASHRDRTSLETAMLRHIQDV